jgi:competence protein ComFC
MKCLLCESLSFIHICHDCQEKFLTPSLYKRKLPNGIEVISFYKYNEIKELLFTKHTDLGFYIYTLLAELSLSKFAKEFVFEDRLISIAIDDNIKSGYSHTAILNRALISPSIKPLYNKLKATNDISYAGKSRQYRLLNPRAFKMDKFKQKSVILVDDIITTGATLTQAIELLTQEGKEVVFCLTLTDVSIA